jgi:hypothetical protein
MQAALEDEASASKWVQCERARCLKWRKLPYWVLDDDIPEHFECSMNKWVPKQVRAHGHGRARQCDVCAATPRAGNRRCGPLGALRARTKAGTRDRFATGDAEGLTAPGGPARTVPEPRSE